jgi:PEP-CTERM motif
MKSKNILTLIVAAGLTLFAAHANAVVLQNDVVFNSSMSSYNIYLEFDGTKWTKYDNGSMPANVYSATGTGSSSLDPLGYTIVAGSGRNPTVFAGSSTSFKLLQGGGVTSYGASSTKAQTTVSNLSYLNTSLVPNNTQYIGLAYNLNVTTKYFGWLSFSNNSDGSQIKIISAYLNPTANQAVTVGVTHNSGGAVAYGATTVPEPSTYGLIGIAALGVAFAARRRKLKTA